MLTTLSIRDFVLIEHLTLELGQGLTTLTGETGAGKSILLDALGERCADSRESFSPRGSQFQTDRKNGKAFT